MRSLLSPKQFKHYLKTGLFQLYSMIHAENRLAKENSPYLLQHKNNPVDWYPWGEEAFKAALELNCPIFLSIGYSTCHWCHVMEQESFENYMCVDQLYVTSTSGHGGWPLSVFLTPKLRPFFGGTYFPPKDSFSQPGFASVLKIIASEWCAKQEKIEQSSDQVVNALNSFTSAIPNSKCITAGMTRSWIQKTLEHFEQTIDSIHGGFGHEPKFPQPINLLFLLDYAQSKNHTEINKESASKMAIKTLLTIYMGGIHDHIGLGFHRYSVDRNWHVPHFEKMLYDQAQLLSAYSRAYVNQTEHGSEENAKIFLHAIDDIVAYVQNNLTDAKGGFYCAEDADSLPEANAVSRKEGAFAVWTVEEIHQVLSSSRESISREERIFCHHFGIRSDGNVSPRYDPHGELKGKNVLHVVHDLHSTAEYYNIGFAECERIIDGCKKALRAVRSERPRPSLDDKILTSWNSLMISGLCEAYRATGKLQILHTAFRAADFILHHTLDPDSMLLYRSFRGNRSSILGFVDDYAFLIASLLDLWECTLEQKYLSFAIKLQERMDEMFWDKSSGGYYQTTSEDSLPWKMKDSQDGTEPAANSVAAMNLVRLNLITHENTYKETYEKLLGYLSKDMEAMPFSRPALLSAIMFEQANPLQISFPAPAVDSSNASLFLSLQRFPFKVFAKTPLDFDNSTIQICRGTMCFAPIVINSASSEGLQEALWKMLD